MTPLRGRLEGMPVGGFNFAQSRSGDSSQTVLLMVMFSP
ncbi:hypothetical protein AM1_E0200 (plasmid) [Acaryochloris marina MBIC11017]|uniref:Uncharacterized protein n=1 Tax=Acaryochloris marina (strain MBIC 11017) TaxID=329726 RepID=A8ZPN2_ACAM1|nr:hypothetical protein AM1_E0200 [Acaryochloris marina MBIC11017]